MSLVNSDSEDLSAGFTIRNLRTAQKYKQSAIFESNFVRFKKDDEQNLQIDAIDELEDEVRKDNTDSSNSDDGCSETSKIDKSCKLQKNSGATSKKDSSSEIEGFLCEQVYEYKCKPLHHGKTPKIQTDAGKAENSDSSNMRLPTGYLNITSDSDDSIKNINSSGSLDETISQTIAHEPPKKRGKNHLPYFLYI